MQAAPFRMNPVQYPSCRRGCHMKSMRVQKGYICLPSLCLPYVELNKRIVCTNRRTRANRHMRRSAVSAGRSDSRKPLGKRGNQSWYAYTAVRVCAALLGSRPFIGRMVKNFRLILEIDVVWWWLCYKLYCHFVQFIVTWCNRGLKCGRICR